MEIFGNLFGNEFKKSNHTSLNKGIIRSSNSIKRIKSPNKICSMHIFLRRDRLIDFWERIFKTLYLKRLPKWICNLKSFSTSDKVFQKIMDINFFGIVRLTNLLVTSVVNENQQVPKKERQICSIVNIGSVQSYLATPYRSACKHPAVSFVITRIHSSNLTDFYLLRLRIQVRSLGLLGFS